MLKGIDPLLGPELLMALASMGHGDELAVVDRNFPAASVGAAAGPPRWCVPYRGGRRVSSACSPSTPSSTSPLSVWKSWANPRWLQPFSKSSWVLPSAVEGRDLRMGSLERFDFYRRAADAFAIVATVEQRGYGNFVISKGGL